MPVENLIGEENKGWTYAKVLLTHERTNIAQVPNSKLKLRKLRDLAARTSDGQGGTLLNDPVFARKLAEVDILSTGFGMRIPPIQRVVCFGLFPRRQQQAAALLYFSHAVFLTST